MTGLRRYLDFAVDLAYQAGRLTLGYFQTGFHPGYKSDDTPVTIADQKAEELIRGAIEKAYPGHGIVGEEFGEKEGTDIRWFIDPIDGTKSFMRGVPLYGVLIGLEIEGKIEVGVANFPALGEMVYAASGLGCYLNGRAARVRATEDLSRSIVSFTDAASFERHGRSEAWRRIQEASYSRVGWSDCYGHMLVATGRLEVMLDPTMNPWDCGPFPVILREAGGYFGSWSGEETIYAGEALSTTKTLLPGVLRLLDDGEAR